MKEIEQALHEIERLREWIVMADNRLECKACPKCINVARSYLHEALKPRNKRRKVRPPQHAATPPIERRS